MEEIEVTIQSILPSEEPQGRFSLRISPQLTVEALLRQLCQEAHTPLRPDYCLRSKGHDLLSRSDTLAQSGIQDGAFLHWTSEESVETKSACSCNTFWFLAIVSFIIGTAGIVTICVLRFKDAETITDYAVVFDAGSTHTAMFIYKWEGSKLNGTAVAAQAINKCTADGSGIAEFENDPEAAGKSLLACIGKAKSYIPNDKHSDTPIYLGATAGMRLLNESNATASEAILNSVRTTLKASGFKLTSPKQWVRIISGAEEGTFSWITSNYATNAFKVKRPGVRGLVAPTIVPSIGAMDLGGASTQITFVPADGTEIPAEYKKVLQLFGHNYTVYTHSYLCYGVKEMAGRVYAAVVQEHPNETQIEHPCLPAGYNETLTHEEIFASPCVSGDAGLNAFGNNIILDNVAQDKNYTFVGLSDNAKCSSLMNRSLFNTSTCPYSRCSFNGVYQPEVTGPFYAFSSFYYVSNFLNLSMGDNTSYSHADLLSSIENLCNSTWAQLQQIPTTGSEKANLMLYCLQSNYINLLLYGGYGFTDDSWSIINFVNQVSNTEVGWTLGFVLNESNSYAASYPEVAIYTVTFALLMVLFCMFMVASVGLAAHGKRRNGAKKNRYRRMSQYGAI